MMIVVIVGEKISGSAGDCASGKNCPDKEGLDQSECSDMCLSGSSLV
jgi:hypothetical protein